MYLQKMLYMDTKKLVERLWISV